MRRLTMVTIVATGLIGRIAWAVEPAPKPLTYSSVMAACNRAVDLCNSLPVISVPQLDGCRAGVAAVNNLLAQLARNVRKNCPDPDPAYRDIPSDAFASCVQDLPTCDPQVRAMIVAEEKRRASCDAADANEQALAKAQIPGSVLKQAQVACSAAIRVMGG